MTNFKTFQSPIGLIKLTAVDTKLKSIWFVDQYDESESLPIPDILERSMIQLNEYFEGKRFRFELELDAEGTSFQKKVWELVALVDFGKTQNYSDIARELGSEKFSRAVGMANGKNPLPIVVPCHRIIGINGKLTGYSGGLEKKKWLLIHEQKYSGNSLFL